MPTGSERNQRERREEEGAKRDHFRLQRLRALPQATRARLRAGSPRRRSYFVAGSMHVLLARFLAAER
ncbi:hypothetical protein chiPu_0015529 [Chiloscyllium punctatum]|uniref:Uncharacterized protein n=1 Tax=Chiloscyllium punctatum TaxID=137246 RepID=A0A401T2Z0_CHIPU|nr:hypothetical protein [Chiloscyllium punctatum]